MARYRWRRVTSRMISCCTVVFKHFNLVPFLGRLGKWAERRSELKSVSKQFLFILLLFQPNLKCSLNSNRTGNIKKWWNAFSSIRWSFVEEFWGEVALEKVTPVQNQTIHFLNPHFPNKPENFIRGRGPWEQSVLKDPSRKNEVEKSYNKKDVSKSLIGQNITFLMRPFWVNL